jgi:hypothetical protein
MLEKIETYTTICQGGWNSNENQLELSSKFPGSASTLTNMEPSLFGGYRKINGYQPLEANSEEVDSTNAEGKIYCTAFFDDKVIVARKQKSGATYNFYYWDVGTGWSAYTTGLTLTSTSVDKIRWATFNFNGTKKIIFVDGVNNATIFDGTNWSNVDPSGTGADFANAGGPQALTAPKYVNVFKNHVFLSGDATYPQIVCHSAPNSEFNWTSAAGAGQIVAGFNVVQLKTFRDSNFVFGIKDIKKIIVSGTNFVIDDVTANIGCIASDSVVEIGGDLLFLAQDGFRTIAGTEKIGDIQLASVSKAIQRDIINLINSSTLSAVNAVVIRAKSQVRFFFSNPGLPSSATAVGIIGAITANGWEWAKISGMNTSTVASDYINEDEYIIHSDFAGNVYRQEQGSSFNGDPITTTYSTPYLDFNDPTLRKTLRKIYVFLRPEGALNLSMILNYDWNSVNTLNPTGYDLENLGGDSIYGVGIYGISVYATTPPPIIFNNVQGSGFSVKATFVTNQNDVPFSIQGIVFEFSVNGRK